MPSVGDVVRLAHADPVPPLLRGHYGQVEIWNESHARAVLRVYVWATTVRLGVSTRDVRVMEPDEAARIRWASRAAWAASASKEPFRELTAAFATLDRMLQDVTGYRGGAMIWTHSSFEEAARLLGHSEGQPGRGGDGDVQGQLAWERFVAAHRQMQEVVEQLLCLDLPND